MTPGLDKRDWKARPIFSLDDWADYDDDNTNQFWPIFAIKRDFAFVARDCTPRSLALHIQAQLNAAIRFLCQTCFVPIEGKSIGLFRYLG
jgi:hypothetical protein